jgi:hypothetical protein
MDEPRKEQTENLFPSGVANFCYGNIPLRTGELSLGLLTPIPRQKQSFGHYHSYKLIFLIEKERRR